MAALKSLNCRGVNPNDITVKDAIRVLMQAGAVFSIPSGKHLCLKSVAAKLDCSSKYVREHLDEFPNAWRMPGGEIRVPESDVEALAKRCKFQKIAATGG